MAQYSWNPRSKIKWGEGKGSMRRSRGRGSCPPLPPSYATGDQNQLERLSHNNSELSPTFLPQITPYQCHSTNLFGTVISGSNKMSCLIQGCAYRIPEMKR